MSEYKPGTVAHITVRDCAGKDDFRAVKDVKGWNSLDPSIGWVPNADVTDVRPLVVLDFVGGRVHAENVVLYLREGGFPDLADDIEAQTRPPKPDEPGKYGAVIAGDGREWFRYATSERNGYDWCRPAADGGTQYAAWADLDVIRVTNEGVQP